MIRIGAIRSCIKCGKRFERSTKMNKQCQECRKKIRTTGNRGIINYMMPQYQLKLLGLLRSGRLKHNKELGLDT